jgi:hypothetical protein
MESSALHLPETHDITLTAEVIRYVSFSPGLSLADLADFLSIGSVAKAQRVVGLACFLGFLKVDGSNWAVTSNGLLFVAANAAKQRDLLQERLGQHELFHFIIGKACIEHTYDVEQVDLPSVDQVQNALSQLARKNGESLSSVGGCLRRVSETIIELVRQLTGDPRRNYSGGKDWFNPFLGRGDDSVGCEVIEAYRGVLAFLCRTLFEDTLKFDEEDVLAAFMYSDTRSQYDEEELISIIELCLALKRQSFFCLTAWSMKNRNSALLEGGQGSLCFATFVYRSLRLLSSLDRESIFAYFRPHPELGSSNDAPNMPVVKKLMVHLERSKGFFDEQLDGILDDNYIEWEEISSELDKDDISRKEAMIIPRIVRAVISNETLVELDSQLIELLDELSRSVANSSDFRMELVDKNKLWQMAKQLNPLLVESFPEGDLFDKLKCRLRDGGYLREREVARGFLLPKSFASNAVDETNLRRDARPQKWLSWIKTQPTTLGREVRLKAARLVEMQESYDEFNREQYSGRAVEWPEAKGAILNHLKCSERGGRLWP